MVVLCIECKLTKTGALNEKINAKDGRNVVSCFAPSILRVKNSLTVITSLYVNVADQ